MNAFGVGERMITARSEPVFGGVYKLCAVRRGDTWEPRIKISDTLEKTTNPGLKEVYRVYNEKGIAVADLITKADEEVDASKPYPCVDPQRPWKSIVLENCTFKKLRSRVIAGGERCYETQPLHEITAYVKRQLAEEIWDEEQRFENPHGHYMDMSPAYYEMKMALLNRAGEKHV